MSKFQQHTLVLLLRKQYNGAFLLLINSAPYYDIFLRYFEHMRHVHANIKMAAKSVNGKIFIHFSPLLLFNTVSGLFCESLSSQKVLICQNKSSKNTIFLTSQN